MAQQHRVGSHCTTISHNPLRVTYHATIVVEQTPEGIRLDSGGWRSATTKTRMNQASYEYNLGFNVFQEKGSWFVELGGKRSGIVSPFTDGMVL